MSDACRTPSSCACSPCRTVTKAVDAARRVGAWRQRIPGGTARNPRSFNREQLIKGALHELEHTRDPNVAIEIAMDHIAEDRRAYIDAMPNGRHAQGPATFGHALADSEASGYEVRTADGVLWYVPALALPSWSARAANRRLPEPSPPVVDRELRAVLKGLRVTHWDRAYGYYSTITDGESTRPMPLLRPGERLGANDDVFVGPFADKLQIRHYWKREGVIDNKGEVPRPRSRRWVKDAIRHPGKLGGRGFVSRPRAEQQEILDECIDSYGTRSCLGSIMLLENLSRDAAHRKRLAELHAYVRRQSGRPITNPSSRSIDRGEWDAIPIIIAPVDLTGATLTRIQVTELEQLTV